MATLRQGTPTLICCQIREESNGSASWVPGRESERLSDEVFTGLPVLELDESLGYRPTVFFVGQPNTGEINKVA